MKRKEFRKSYEINQGLEQIILFQALVPGNTGNTARKFFNNIEKVSEITQLDKNLLIKLSSILKTLNSGFEINIDKFDIYCKETAELYIYNYEWYYMPISLHKIFFHSSQTIEKHQYLLEHLLKKMLKHATRQ